MVFKTFIKKNEMKNIYKILYTVDNTNEFEDSLFEIDSIIEENNDSDIDMFLDMIEQSPSKKVIDNILSFVFNK